MAVLQHGFSLENRDRIYRICRSDLLRPRAEPGPTATKMLHTGMFSTPHWLPPPVTRTQRTGVPEISSEVSLLDSTTMTLEIPPQVELVRDTLGVPDACRLACSWVGLWWLVHACLSLLPVPDAVDGDVLDRDVLDGVSLRETRTSLWLGAHSPH
jgi:hypothetical protein